MTRESSTPTPWAVYCSNGHEQVFLTREEYDRQMNLPNALWQCPKCYAVAYWDDDNYEHHLDAQAEGEAHA